MFAVKSSFVRTLVPFALSAMVLAGCAAPTQAPTTPATGSADSPASSSAPASGDGILRIVQTARIPAPDIWNPYIPGTFILQGMNQNMMEPLFMLNYETGEIDGWLGESFSANETLDEWIVVLRPGTEWSDGQPLTSEDVVFTFELLKEYAPQLNWSGAVDKWVESVEAVDDRTIKFTLTGPNPRFVMENLAGTTSQAIVPLPKHVWEGVDPITFRNEFNEETGAPIFSGPYTVLRFSPTEFIYERNDDWWGAKTGTFNLPAPLEIHRVWQPSQETIDQLLIDNQLDIGAGITGLSQMQALQAQNPKLISFNPEPPYAWRDPCPRMFTVNTTVAPWDQKEMRWALSNAFNRQQIVDVVWEGTSVPTGFIFPDYPAMMPYINEIQEIIAPVMEYNPERSRELIEAQGYTLDGSGKFVGPDGNNLTIDVVAPPFMEPVATMVVQQLNDVGIDAVLRIIEWGIFREQTGRGEFEGATDWSGCGSVIEPWFGMNRYNKSWVQPIGESGTEYVDNTNNSGRWVNDEYSALVDQMGSLPLGDPQIMDLMTQAVTIWVDEMPAIPLAQQPALTVFNTANWTGWPTIENNYIQPPSHWQHFLRVLTELEPAQ